MNRARRAALESHSEGMQGIQWEWKRKGGERFPLTQKLKEHTHPGGSLVLLRMYLWCSSGVRTLPSEMTNTEKVFPWQWEFSNPKSVGRSIEPLQREWWTDQSAGFFSSWWLRVRDSVKNTIHLVRVSFVQPWCILKLSWSHLAPEGGWDHPRDFYWTQVCLIVSWLSPC